MELPDIKYDILNELFNIGVGKAAALLSRIVQKRITLQVPRVFFFGDADSTQELDERLSHLLNGTLMVSSISFSEKLKGKANLVFPADKMHSFISLCTGESMEVPTTGGDFTDIDFDVVKEIGNIVLNSILGELGNYLGIPLNYSLPEVKVFDRKINFHKDIETEAYKSALILSVTFNIADERIEGAIFIDLTATSCRKLFHLLSGIEEELDG